MKYLNYETEKVLEFNEATSQSRIIDTVQVASEIDLLGKRIAELEGVLKDDKKLLTWAKEVYPHFSGLNQMKEQLEIQVSLDSKIKEII
jgi:hypothetical protein